MMEVLKNAAVATIQFQLVMLRHSLTRENLALSLFRKASRRYNQDYHQLCAFLRIVAHRDREQGEALSRSRCVSRQT